MDTNGDLKLSRKQQTDLKIIKSTNITEINKLNSKINDLEERKKEKIESRDEILKETIRQTEVVDQDIIVKKTVKGDISFDGGDNTSCCKLFIEQIYRFNNDVEEEKFEINQKNLESYDKWSKNLYSINCCC